MSSKFQVICQCTRWLQQLLVAPRECAIPRAALSCVSTTWEQRDDGTVLTTARIQGFQPIKRCRPTLMTVFAVLTNSITPRQLGPFRLEKTLKNHQVQPLSHTAKSNTNHVPSVTSTCHLNSFRDGDSAIALGNLFQCSTTLLVKKFFLILNLTSPAPPGPFE